MSNQSQPIWDRKARLLHWGLAFAITADYFLEGGDEGHNYVGYAALVFVIIRLYRGFFQKFHRENIIARITYILIWLDVLALAVTGYLYGTDRFWGEEWLSDLHLKLADGMLVLIGLHLLGIIKDSLQYKRKTWMGMITGFKASFASKRS